MSSNFRVEDLGPSHTLDYRKELAMKRPPGVDVIWKSNFANAYAGFYGDRHLPDLVDLIFRVNAMVPPGSTLEYKLVKEQGRWCVMEMKVRRRHRRWTGYYLSVATTLRNLDRLQGQSM